MTVLNKELFILDIKINVKEFPLKKNYSLSFAVLEKFVSIQSTIYFSNKKNITTEVVPLVGYNDETQEIIIKNLSEWGDKIKGMNIEDARSFILDKTPIHPFSSSPILTAIDLLNLELEEVDHDSLPYVIPTSTLETDEFKSLLKSSHQTIKIKLSGNVDKDINGLSEIQSDLNNYSLKLRLDANQAYSYKEAHSLFEFISNQPIKDYIQYIEQPLPVKKEVEMGLLRQKFKDIDIMLDESIITINDLQLAMDNDIKYIKLKLFKQGGIIELISIAKEAKNQGLKVILGNGVATHVSNYIENEIYKKNKALFTLPLESNGFKKVVQIK